ncbi:MAG: hypothetical protein WA441_08385 [Methyloceanibacter sp.]
MSAWRKEYKAHPGADLFPMMSDEELEVLGRDIKANGLRSTIVIAPNGLLLDGRNRLEAMERAGVALQTWHTRAYGSGDPVAYIISANIHRRHLTKQQQADLIVAVHKAAANPSPNWRRGTADPVKAAAVATAKEHGISKRTVERSLAKTRPAPKPKPARKAPPAAPEDADYMRLLKVFQQSPIATRQRFLTIHTKTAAPAAERAAVRACVSESDVQAIAVEIAAIVAQLPDGDLKLLIEKMTVVTPDLAYRLRLLLAKGGSPWL